MSESRLVYVRYLDHVLFKDVNPATYEPQVRETVGWLAEDNNDYIRVVWERFDGSPESGNVHQRSTGLVILKSSILGMKEVK